MDLGFQEIFLIAIIALLVYGGELPGVMRTLGRTVGSIKRSFQDGSRDITDKLDLKQDLAVDLDLPRIVQRAPSSGAFPANEPAPHDVATEDISGRDGGAGDLPEAESKPPEPTTPPNGNAGAGDEATGEQRSGDPGNAP